MGREENRISNRIQTGAVDQYTRVFRNNVGKAWQGKSSTLEDGSILLQHPRRINFGLCEHSSDLIALRSIVVTQEMVGQRVAVFGALEVKTPDGTATDGQNGFIDMVKGMGGLAGVVRSLEQAEWILKK